MTYIQKHQQGEKNQREKISKETGGGFKEIYLINCCKRGAVVKKLRKRTEGKKQTQMLREKSE